MKTLYENCRLPLSGGTRFAVENGRFAPCTPPYGKTADLGGACVLPAFVDAHSHILAYALSLLQADGSGCRTAEEYLACAEKFARERGLPADAPVTVKNAEVFPPPASLDGARPLHLQARSGHAGLFNAAARRLWGIGKAGVLNEKEYLTALSRLPMPAEKDMFAAFSKAQEDYLSHGFCLAQEGILTPAMFPLYEALLARGALKLDVTAYAAPADYDEARRRFPSSPQEKSRLHLGGVKIFLDGSPQQKTAFLRTPYEGGGRGMSVMTRAETLDACLFAADRGAQLLAHCNGDGAAEIFLGALEKLPSERRARIRPVLIHGQVIGEDQLGRAAALGVFVSFFPAHVRHWGETHLKNLGEERAKRISPARTALSCGVKVTLHQDTPVCKPDPLEAASCAVNRITAHGMPFAGENITVKEALSALTKTAAEQYGADMGAIQHGLRAHFIVTDKDPLSLPPPLLETVRVQKTYLGGEPAFTRTR